MFFDDRVNYKISEVETMGFGLKIGGISLNKLTEIDKVAELAIKANMPLTNMAVCTKLAETLLYGALRKNLIEKNFPAAKLIPLEVIKTDALIK